MSKMLRGNRKQLDDEDVAGVSFRSQEKQETIKEILAQIQEDYEETDYARTAN